MQNSKYLYYISVAVCLYIFIFNSPYR